MSNANSKRTVRHRFSDIPHYGLHFSKPSKTEQSCYEDVNIHSIVSRGMNSMPVNTFKPIYNVNLKEVGDYQSVLQRSADLKNSFESLPTEVRERFNSVEEMVAFCEDREKNYEEGLKLGLFSETKEPTVFEKSIEKIASFYDLSQKSTETASPAVISPAQSSGDNNS